jgi:hypothetical protein
VPHLALCQSRIRFPRARSEAPIRGEEEQDIVALPVPLAQFEDRLLARHIISAMAIDENDSPKSMLEEILRQPVKRIEIHPRRRRERARKIEMMIRIAEPGERGEKRAVIESHRHTPHNLAEQQAVSEHWHVMPVLLESGDRENHRCVFR